MTMTMTTHHQLPEGFTRNQDGLLEWLGRELTPGPWHLEPDHLSFTSPGGLPCILHRGGSGAWCGYVGIPPGHPWRLPGRDGDYDLDSLVHGGITYARSCQPPICHDPAPGEPDDLLWFGFDCAHAGDRTLCQIASGTGLFDEYRTIEFCKEQTLQLAKAASAAGMEKR